MVSRREWMIAWAAIAGAAKRADAQDKLEFFTAAEAREVEAIAAAIIPTDETPGAREAGVIHFIDRAMPVLGDAVKAAYRKGLADLGPFASLDEPARIASLKSIETTPFFLMLRMHTIMGFLADPKYGGNRGRAGWKLIGFQGAHAYEPPFGFYDREA